MTARELAIVALGAAYLAALAGLGGAALALRALGRRCGWRSS